MSAPKDKLRQLLRSAKNSLKTYNEVEKRVREATSNDPWPSTSTLMMRIVADTDDHFLYDSMLSMLLKRLQDTSQIMHVKKALILADFLLRNAGGRFINDMKSRLHIFENLSSYRYLVEGSDKGADGEFVTAICADAIFSVLTACLQCVSRQNACLSCCRTTICCGTSANHRVVSRKGWAPSRTSTRTTPPARIKTSLIGSTRLTSTDNIQCTITT